MPVERVVILSVMSVAAKAEKWRLRAEWPGYLQSCASYDLGPTPSRLLWASLQISWSTSAGYMLRPALQTRYKHYLND